jgi:hypothetical protein
MIYSSHPFWVIFLCFSHILINSLVVTGKCNAWCLTLRKVFLIHHCLYSIGLHWHCNMLLVPPVTLGLVLLPLVFQLCVVPLLFSISCWTSQTMSGDHSCSTSTWPNSPGSCIVCASCDVLWYQVRTVGGNQTKRNTFFFQLYSIWITSSGVVTCVLHSYSDISLIVHTSTKQHRARNSSHTAETEMHNFEVMHMQFSKE